MAEETKDVKEEESTPTPVQEEKEETTVVSEDVKTPEVVDKGVYEKVREAMQKEREEKKAIKSQNQELVQRIEDLETRETVEPFEESTSSDARVDVIYEMNKDPFIRDNLDVIEGVMSERGLGVKEASLAVKAEMFDRIHKEEVAAPTNKPLKQTKPTATGEEESKQSLSNDPSANLKRALKGELDIDPGQLEAIKRYFPKQK